MVVISHWVVCFVIGWCDSSLGCGDQSSGGSESSLGCGDQSLGGVFRHWVVVNRHWVVVISHWVVCFVIGW